MEEDHSSRPCRKCGRSFQPWIVRRDWWDWNQRADWDYERCPSCHSYLADTFAIVAARIVTFLFWLALGAFFDGATWTYTQYQNVYTFMAGRFEEAGDKQSARLPKLPADQVRQAGRERLSRPPTSRGWMPPVDRVRQALQERDQVRRARQEHAEWYRKNCTSGLKGPPRPIRIGLVRRRYYDFRSPAEKRRWQRCTSISFHFLGAGDY